MARKLEERLKALRDAPDAAAVREALRSTTGLLVAAACRHVAEHPALATELPGAFARLCEQPIKRDPTCRGKVAVARALHELERWEDEVFARGVRFVQLEPAFGGPVDTAAELRGVCGLAYAHFLRPEALEVLAELLADREPAARVAAAQGIGDAGRTDGGALLRFKLLVGDSEPEVLAACLESVLHLGGAHDFVAGLLARGGERAEAAALALGARRDDRAFEPLVAWCGESLPEPRRRVGYVALALLRSERAIAWLVAIVRDGERGDALAAAKALATFKDDRELCARVLAAAPRALRPEIEAMLSSGPTPP